MQIKHWFSGAVSLEITCADVNGFLNILMQDRIVLADVKLIDELSAQIKISKSDYFKFTVFSEKYSCDIKVLKYEGIQSIVETMLKRKLLIFGMILFGIASIWIPRNILFIQVAGNETIPSREIVEQAASSGLYFGCSRKAIRSEQIKNRLLEKIPRLQWVGINSSGCVATISVKERTDQSVSEEESKGPSSIVATKDGIVCSVTATRGSVLCQVGQPVSKGQVLISSYTTLDSAIIYTRAEGEIFADTAAQVEILSIKNPTVRADFTDSETRYSMIFGKKLIKLYKDSGILDSTCVKIRKEYNVTLPGDFSLPVKVIAETVQHHHITDQNDDTEQYLWLLNRADEYLKTQMIAGRITDRVNTYFSDESFCGYLIDYSCNEMIGQRKKEELFDLNGKNS